MSSDLGAFLLTGDADNMSNNHLPYSDECARSPRNQLDDKETLFKLSGHLSDSSYALGCYNNDTPTSNSPDANSSDSDLNSNTSSSFMNVRRVIPQSKTASGINCDTVSKSTKSKGKPGTAKRATATLSSNTPPDLSADLQWYDHCMEKVKAIIEDSSLRPFEDVWMDLKEQTISPLVFKSMTDTTVCSALFLKSNFLLLHQENIDLKKEVAELNETVRHLVETIEKTTIPNQKPDSFCGLNDIAVEYPKGHVLPLSDLWIVRHEDAFFRPVHAYMVFIAYVAKKTAKKRGACGKISSSVIFKKLADVFVSLVVKPEGNQHWSLSTKSGQTGTESADTADSAIRTQENLKTATTSFPDKTALRFAVVASILIKGNSDGGSNNVANPSTTYLQEFLYHLRYSLNDLHRESRSNVAVFSDEEYRSFVLGMETQLDKRAHEFGLGIPL